MTLLTPIALKTIGMFALALGALAVIAYILKMRRRRFEVPFSTLWHRVLKEKENTTLWKHLRRILSLLLQLAILALLLFAALDPRLGESDRDARNVVIIVDASASMKALDGGEDGDRRRIDVAREEAHEILSSMGSGDAAMLMRMDGQTTPLSRLDSDFPMLHKYVDEIRASDTPADLGRALSAAADALRGRRNPMIVVIGDGVYPDQVLDRVIWEPLAKAAPAATEATDGANPGNAGTEGGAGKAADGELSARELSVIDLSGIDTRFVPVGGDPAKASNVGIVAFNVRRYIKNKMSYEVFLEVQNFGDEPAKRKLLLYNGELAIDVRSLELDPGERLREIYPGLSGGTESRLRAVLQPADAAENDAGGDASAPAARADADIFPLDDEAFALLPARRRQKVLLVTEDNLYLEGAMLVYENIQVDKLTGPEFDAAVAGGSLPDYDALVFDDFTPNKLPAAGHVVYFNPDGEHGPFPIRRHLGDRPRITETDDNHPVMRWLVMSDVNFTELSVFDLNREEGEVALGKYVRDPVIAAKRDGGRKIVAFGFSLSGTDLTLRVAFPLLLVNTLDWFAGDDADLITTYTTGQRFRVPLDATLDLAEVEVRTPSGRLTRAPVVDGNATFYGSQIGVHRLVGRKDGAVVAALELAANLSSPSESNVAPVRELAMGGRTLTAPDGFTITRKQTLWMYLVLLVVLLLCVEWFTYNRRVTV